jgi:hypothetical protein
MARNRFEQVDEIQPDAITLSLAQQADGQTGNVTFPATASGGRLTEDRISEQLPAVDAFRSAVRLANEMKVALVVFDPDGVWKTDWGDLYRDADPG